MDLDYFGYDISDEDEEPIITPSKQPDKVPRTNGDLRANRSDSSQHLDSMLSEEVKQTSAEMEAFLDAASTEEEDSNEPNVDPRLNQSDAFDPN